MLMKMGKMAFKMLEKNTSLFFEEDLKEHGLKLTEVTVFSGLCTELPTATSTARRKFCFVHLTFQVRILHTGSNCHLTVLTVYLISP